MGVGAVDVHLCSHCFGFCLMSGWAFGRGREVVRGPVGVQQSDSWSREDTLEPSRGIREVSSVLRWSLWGDGN